MLVFTIQIEIAAGSVYLCVCVCVGQYFYSALRDCVRPMRATCHAESTDVVVKHFESEMIANVREVILV